MNRRVWIAAGIPLIGLGAAGLWLSTRRAGPESGGSGAHDPGRASPNSLPASDAAVAPSSTAVPGSATSLEGRAASAALWDTRLPRPDGSELALAGLRGRPLVLNFWATWCTPCIREMPLLDRFAAEHPAISVVGIAVDRTEAVQKFLAKAPVRFQIGVAGFAGTGLARELGNPQGGLPFSLAIARDGSVSAHRIGELRAEDLRDWAQRLAR